MVPKKPRSALANVLIAAVIITGIVAGSFLIYQLVTPKSIIEIPGAYSLAVKDGKTNVNLGLDNFDYTLYGTDDLAEWLDYEVIESGSGLSRIAAGDLVDYEFFVVRFNGTVPEEDFDDELGDRIYYERWAEITTGANVLTAFQTPSTVGVVAINTNTLAVVNIGGSELVGNVNVTFFIAGNGSQEFAAYVLQFNYETQDFDRPRLLLTYNATVTSDIALTIKGTTRVRVSATVYSYTFTELGPVANVFMAEWGESATTAYKVSTAALYYGETAL